MLTRTWHCNCNCWNSLKVHLCSHRAKNIHNLVCALQTEVGHDIRIIFRNIIQNRDKKRPIKAVRVSMRWWRDVAKQKSTRSARNNSALGQREPQATHMSLLKSPTPACVLSQTQPRAYKYKPQQLPNPLPPPPPFPSNSNNITNAIPSWEAHHLPPVDANSPIVATPHPSPAYIPPLQSRQPPPTV